MKEYPTPERHLSGRHYLRQEKMIVFQVSKDQCDNVLLIRLSERYMNIFY